MISTQEEEYILRKAYVPEHIPDLMSLISGGEPFLRDGYLFFVKNGLLMFIGFPLDREFEEDTFTDTLRDAAEQFNIEDVRFIASVLPTSFTRSCRHATSDHYYRLDIETFKIKSSLKRECEKVSQVLSLGRNKEYTSEHQDLVKEFIERVSPEELVKALYMSMEEYVSSSQTAYLLDARDKNGNLSAFYVIDTAATDFLTYLIGCYSKQIYVPHASDLLMRETINIAQNEGKQYIHLGLGVNGGIRKFKEKWSGYPFLKYEYCEQVAGSSIKHGLMDYLRSKL